MIRLPVEIDILRACSIVSQARTGGVIFPDLMYLDSFLAVVTCHTTIISPIKESLGAGFQMAHRLGWRSIDTKFLCLVTNFSPQLAPLSQFPDRAAPGSYVDITAGWQ